jgi:hypothetical protein
LTWTLTDKTYYADVAMNAGLNEHWFVRYKMDENSFPEVSKTTVEITFVMAAAFHNFDTCIQAHTQIHHTHLISLILLQKHVNTNLGSLETS